MQFAFSARRAMADVDSEPGLVGVVALDTAQDVGKALWLLTASGRSADRLLRPDRRRGGAGRVRGPLRRVPFRPEHITGT